MVSQLLIVSLAITGLILARQAHKTLNRACIGWSAFFFALALIIANWVIYWEIYIRTGSPIKEWILSTFFNGERVW